MQKKWNEIFKIKMKESITDGGIVVESPCEGVALAGFNKVLATLMYVGLVLKCFGA